MDRCASLVLLYVLFILGQPWALKAQAFAFFKPPKESTVLSTGATHAVAVRWDAQEENIFWIKSDPKSYLVQKNSNLEMQFRNYCFGRDRSKKLRFKFSARYKQGLCFKQDKDLHSTLFLYSGDLNASRFYVTQIQVTKDRSSSGQTLKNEMQALESFVAASFKRKL